tara:strand:+ start:82798 stop:83400 length:603 start_codon:yes stop_codon:yes gene_type:complete
MYTLIKYLFDKIFALSLFIILLPFLILIYFILTIHHSGNPLFMQTRVGLNEKFFKIIKFRTMNSKRDKNGMLLNDSLRITKIGVFLRKFSIDELPQILNVLSGNMSFVGPRPLLPEYLSLYNKDQKKRHNVKPGITGLAQIMGRNNISWKQKFEFDIEYVRKQSFFLDVNIILKSISKVIFAYGINSLDNKPIEPFNGKN